MSRAFVREDAGGFEPPPELKISPHPNLVTPRGLALMDEKIAELKHGLAAAGDDAEKAAITQRDLRYWTARHATAQVTHPPADGDEVAFGSRVVIKRTGHEEETVEIVGEDEADPAAGKLSWVSPVARALAGALVGQTVTVGQRQPPLTVEVISVQNAPAA